MNNSPIKGFEDFLKITDSNTSLYEIDENTIDDSIRPFLSNPGRHWEHVKLMAEAKWGI